MRAYFFGNFYLSSIQQGIQAQHCTAEMFVKYQCQAGEKTLTLFDWAENYKTSILFNGGDCDGLTDIRTLLMCDENPYPWAYFKESTGALLQALTCVGIILPEKIWVGAEGIRKAYRGQYIYQGPTLTEWERKLCVTMNKCGMAR